jgi:hypothetical protein
MRLISSILFAFVIPLQGMGTQILLLPSSAVELSMGSHTTLEGLFPINPALYKGSENHPYLSLNRGNWLGDVSLSQIGYNQTGFDKVMHLGLKYSGLTDLEFRDDTPQDNAAANFSAYGIILDAGVAFKRGNQRYGISMSYVQFGLYTEDSKGFSLDAGYAIEMRNGYTFGIVAKNLGKMSELESKHPVLPKRFSSGLSKQFQFENFKNSVFGSIEWNSTVSTSKFHMGNRFSWNRLELFSGYSTSEQIAESSIGIGINMNRYQITYGTRFGSQDLGFPKLLSIRVQMP